MFVFSQSMKDPCLTKCHGALVVWRPTKGPDEEEDCRVIAGEGDGEGLLSWEIS